MNFRRRRKRYEAKRPKSQVAVVTASIGGAIIVVWVILISLTVSGDNNAAKWMAGTGVISMLLSAVCFGKSIEPFRDKSFDGLNRWSGMLLPLAALLLWVWIYFAGIIFG